MTLGVGSLKTAEKELEVPSWANNIGEKEAPEQLQGPLLCLFKGKFGKCLEELKY